VDSVGDVEGLSLGTLVGDVEGLPLGTVVTGLDLTTTDGVIVGALNVVPLFMLFPFVYFPFFGPFVEPALDFPFFVFPLGRFRCLSI
jgi:hypothetical protein